MQNYCFFYLPNTKFVLNHFDPKAKNTRPFPPIALDGHVIEVSETVKYLKIILDRRLEFLQFGACIADHTELKLKLGVRRHTIPGIWKSAP